MGPLADTGRVIAGRYRLVSPVGRGAMGVVWRARDELLDRDVAVKEVQIAETLTAPERENAYQRTLREAKTAARLSHPGVVSVYDVASDQGRPWIVMELVNARSLDQVLTADGPLPARQTAEIGRQLLAALSVAHAAGVLHRDVKPSNVLLGYDGRAVLTDFGIATFQGDPKLTQTGMVMGSPGFTAPERIRGGDATPASDLWSLGATLFAAVQGYGPYESRGGVITTMSAIINEDAPAAGAAGALAPVIDALLRREPEQRPDAATATRMMADALPLLPDQPGPAPGSYVPTALSPSSPGLGDLGVAGPSGVAGFPGAGAGAVGAVGAVGETFLDGPRAPATSPHGDAYAPPTTPQPAGSGGSGGRYESPPPDFSSWYDPSPRTSSRARESGWPAPPPVSPPPAQVTPARAGYGSPKRRGSARWKVALAALFIVGAGSGAAAVVAYRHNHTVTPGPAGHTGPAVTGTGGLVSGSGAALPPITTTINEPTGSTPAGFTGYSLPSVPGKTTAGFTVAYPSGWTVKRSGYRTYFYDPSGNANVLIDLTPHTYQNMLKEAGYIRDQNLNGTPDPFPGYKPLTGGNSGISAATVRGTSGAFWKFTWTDNGVTQEVFDLVFILQTKNGPQSYALYFTGPASQWNALHTDFNPMAETFGPQA
jgi:eukaryotic-like serine/threonine-protein kinase